MSNFEILGGILPIAGEMYSAVLRKAPRHATKNGMHSVHPKPTGTAPFHLLSKPIGPLCNIACDYCFYLEKEEMFGNKVRSEYAMSDEVLDAYVANYIAAQPEGTVEVNFAWQGGEPTLLGTEFFERAVSYQKKYARRGMTITNAIQTNGILMSRERARWFRDHDFLVGVSIDGPEELHDRYRRTRTGGGTFREVMQGIENLVAEGTEFNTLTVVQSDNGHHPETVYDFLKSIGSRFLQFIPIVEPLPEAVAERNQGDTSGRAGGGTSRRRGAAAVSDRTVPAALWGSFLNGVFDRWLAADVGDVFVQHFDMLLGIHAGRPSSLCVHSRHCGRALAIEHDGSLFSCDHFVTQKHRVGSILHDELSAVVDGNKQRTFGTNKFDLLPNKCRKCPYLRLCYGACPKDRIIHTPSGKLNWLCEGYFAFYEHTAPVFEAMARAIANGRPALDWQRFR